MTGLLGISGSAPEEGRFCKTYPLRALMAANATLADDGLELLVRVMLDQPDTRTPQKWVH